VVTRRRGFRFMFGADRPKGIYACREEKREEGVRRRKRSLVEEGRGDLRGTFSGGTRGRLFLARKK